MNDFILILQMKQGNDQAFDKFVRKYYADILSYCRYHCLNQTEAEDLTQETFLRFINNIQSYQHMGKAKNYLYVIAGNLCKNSAKKWKAESIETEVLERELVSDGDIPKKENQMYVEHALEQMQPELTVFLTVVCIGMKMQFMDLLVQFLFPMVITAGICFVMLNCSFLNEATSILGCFIWGVIWWGVAMNNAIYERIAMPIWIILFVFAICFLIGAVYKTIHECNRFLEVNLYGITNG